MGADPDALAKLIRDSGVAFRENATSFSFECPRCQKANKLAMYKSSGGFICYHCAADGFKGRPEYALTELLGLPIGQIRKRIYGTETPNNLEELHIELTDFWGENEDELFAPDISALPPREVMWPPDVCKLGEPTFKKGHEYLKSRGITDEHIRTYDIRYSPVDRRVLFPVKVEGVLVGWQGRYIGPTEFWDDEQGRMRRVPKVITSDSLMGRGKRYLMFQDRLKGSSHAVLTEGPVTAIKAHLCGGNVATMGKDVSEEQLRILRKMGIKRLYIALDPDAGEQIAKIAREMNSDMEIYLLMPPQNFLNLDDPQNDEDLGDLSDEEVYKVFVRAKPEDPGKIYLSLGNILAC